MLNSIYQVYYIGISDFLDRIRSKSIFIITLFMMYLSYLFFPQNYSSFYYTLNYFHKGYLYRSIYNSVWLGWVATIAFISIITFLGFYFVRNSINRERELLIGEITASTGTKSWIYIFGKAFGNLLFLLALMLIVILITVIMQFVRGESYYFQPIKLMIPFLVLAIPACFITAVIAIIFEVIPPLAGSFGNVTYFFVWCGIFIAGSNKKTISLVDVFGINTTAGIILEQLGHNFKELQNMDAFSLGIGEALHGNIKTFIMNGANISANVILGRFFWVLVGVLLLFLASMIFKRTSLIRTKVSANVKSIAKEKVYNTEKRTILSEVFEEKTYSNNLSIIKSELKVLLASLNLWWYGAAILCAIGVFFTEGESLYKLLIPAIWILPVFIWSKLGIIQYNMEDYLFTYNNYRDMGLINSIAAGILFTILINMTVVIKFALSNNFLGIAYILMGIFFVNSLGMFIGNLTGNSTAFEVTYIILWYVGILNGFKSLNFLGITQEVASARTHIPIIFLAIGVFLMISSIILRNIKINAK